MNCDLGKLTPVKFLKQTTIRFGVENLCFWVANSEGLDSDNLIKSSYGTGTYIGKTPTYFTINLKINI
jgi:hypothetical protein